jgi:hypothetical protein
LSSSLVDANDLLSVSPSYLISLLLCILSLSFLKRREKRGENEERGDQKKRNKREDEEEGERLGEEVDRKLNKQE